MAAYDGEKTHSKGLPRVPLLEKEAADDGGPQLGPEARWLPGPHGASQPATHRQYVLAAFLLWAFPGKKKMAVYIVTWCLLLKFSKSFLHKSVF